MPWLCELYQGAFLDLANAAWREPVTTARDPRYSVVLNVQRGPAMRFECHVDSNPLSGLLFFTDHPSGGELAVANDPAAQSVGDVEGGCSLIHPQAGHMVFFDGRYHPHYARPLLAEADVRVLSVMNFYTRSSPELARPRELNHHLYGDPL